MQAGSRMHYAACILQDVAASLAVEACERVKLAIDAEAILPDVKKDTLRLIDKIEEYAAENYDLGYLYVKDAVRMSFSFTTLVVWCAVEKLLQRSRKLWDSDTTNSYFILK